MSYEEFADLMFDFEGIKKTPCKECGTEEDVGSMSDLCPECYEKKFGKK